MTASPRYDVVVIGGGPAGATAATLLSQAGRRVAVFERETFPRYHVGESLIPETYWVLRRLGLIEKLRQSPFVRKHSVQFVGADGRPSAPFYFHDNRPHESSQTWQVLRSQFDQMLLDNAREHGAEAYEGVHVLDVRFHGARATGIRVQGADGTRREVAADVVVDASGQACLLQNRRGLRVWDPVLDKGSVWAYWQGARRGAGIDEGATMVLQTADRQGWFWYIPLHDDVVSVGVVAPFDDIFRGRGSHEDAFAEQLDRCPGVRERVAGARRVTGYFATRDYSYRSREVAGHGWVLVGDAFQFLDPLYSSGVLLALKSGELAADAIHRALENGDTSGAALGGWGPSFNRGVDRMRRLVCEYYAGFSFGRFVRQYPHLRGAVTDLLIGDLFTDRVDAVWGPMETLHGQGHTALPAWHEGLSDEQASHRVNELVLPDGPRP